MGLYAKAEVEDQSLCQLRLFAPNAVSEYQTLMNDVNVALYQEGSAESTIPLGNFNAHI